MTHCIISHTINAFLSCFAQDNAKSEKALQGMLLQATVVQSNNKKADPLLKITKQAV